jgi:hypothetical protein
MAPIGKPKRRITIEPKREGPVRRDEPSEAPRRDIPTPQRREKVPA